MKHFACTLLLAFAAWGQSNDACYALRGNRAPDVVARMRRAIEDPAIRACAARNLREAGAIAELIDAVESGSPDARVAAAHELGELRDARALPALGKAALEPNQLVASNAVEALGSYAGRDALPFLLAASETPTVAGLTALEQAARLRDPAVLPLARRILAGNDVAAQVIALTVVADLGDASDIPLLRELEKHSEKVSVRGRGFGFMPAIDLARAAHNTIERVQSR